MEHEMKTTACFTGHRLIPRDDYTWLGGQTMKKIKFLIQEKNVTHFLCGGALGFDQLAASIILYLKRDYDITLTLALPCPDRMKDWPALDAKIYDTVIERAADDLFCVSAAYAPDCMKNRNFYMVDHSQYVICYLKNTRSGTAQTVRYADKLNRPIFATHEYDRANIVLEPGFESYYW